MAYPDNLLSRGERVVLHKHPHWKVLVLPVLVFIVAVGGGSAFAAWVSHWRNVGFTSHPQWYIGIAVVAVLLLVFFVLVPVLRWITEHFVISTGHVFFRTGILRRREHQIPLARIQNMETEVGFWGRLLGYGSLIVESAADQPLEFENVASLPKVQAALNQLISDDRGRSPQESTAGDGSAGPAPAAPAETTVDDREQHPRRSSRARRRPVAESARAPRVATGGQREYQDQPPEHPAGPAAGQGQDPRQPAGQGQTYDEIVYQQYADAEYGPGGRPDEQWQGADDTEVIRDEDRHPRQ